MSEILLQKRKPSSLNVQNLSETHFPNFTLNQSGLARKSGEVTKCQMKALYLDELTSDIKKLFQEQQGDIRSVKQCMH
jgi:hypothetical protein